MPSRPDLLSLVEAASPDAGAALHAPGRRMSWRKAAACTIFNGEREQLADKSVLIAVRAQMDAALAMLELDGLARRMTIVPPDFSKEQLLSTIRQAGVEAIVCDNASEVPTDLPRVEASPPREARAVRRTIETEWVLPTSGTTGQPKLVAHGLAGLVGAFRFDHEERRVWSTFYDIRRYGGLQILLRAAIGGAPLVISDSDEALADHVARMAEMAVTHVSGTPSHWRKLLMSGEANRISPRYLRLSGEVADRAILEALAATYPGAKIVHAYASTEAGVGFEVTDGREGFPASWLDGGAGVDLRLVDGSLHVRSRRTASNYVGRDDLRLKDAAGFVDTDDLVEVVGDRCFFRGRRAGTINVGGLKVHPEEVEQVINTHSCVQMSLVKARRSPITGDLIVADVVLKDEADQDRNKLKEEIVASCRARLDRHKVPAMIGFVSGLPMSPAGKLLRRGA